MKKLLAASAVILLVIITIAASLLSAPKESDYLRIHIRANSNSEYDQSVKYKVKDAIVEYLSDMLAKVTTKAEAMDTISTQTDRLSTLASAVLKQNGYAYAAKVELRKEEFPARNYRDVTLSEGIYDALIVELGSGQGDNWWCVAFPPLCFLPDSKNVQYKSLFRELFGG